MDESSCDAGRVPGLSEVTVRRTDRGDLSDLCALWNDGRVMRWVGYPNGLGYELGAVERWFDAIRDDHDRRHCVIRHDELGFCGELYYARDTEHRRAALDVKLVPEAQGRGIATRGLTTLIDLVFECEHDMDAVWTEPSEENAAARRLYARCGLAPAPRPIDLGSGTYWELRRDAWAARRAGLPPPRSSS